MADRDLVTCLYHADDGTAYRTKQDSTIIAQVNGSDPVVPITGAVALSGADTHEELPALLRPRGVYVTKSGANPRFVVCMTADAPLYNSTVDHPVTSINLQQLGGSAAAYTKYKTKSERDHRKGARPA